MNWLFAIGAFVFGGFTGWVACESRLIPRLDEIDCKVKDLLVSILSHREAIDGYHGEIRTLQDSLDKSVEANIFLASQNKDLQREKKKAEELAKMIGAQPGPDSWRSL